METITRMNAAFIVSLFLLAGLNVGMFFVFLDGVNNIEQGHNVTQGTAYFEVSVASVVWVVEGMLLICWSVSQVRK